MATLSPSSNVITKAKINFDTPEKDRWKAHWKGLLMQLDIFDNFSDLGREVKCGRAFIYLGHNRC